MKIRLMDLAVALIVLLGILSDLDKIDVPWYVFVICLVAYAGLRYAGKESEPLKK